MSQTSVLEKLKSDNSLNKEKIKNLQINDGIFNDQLQILVKNMLKFSDDFTKLSEEIEDLKSRVVALES